MWLLVSFLALLGGDMHVNVFGDDWRLDLLLLVVGLVVLLLDKLLLLLWLRLDELLRLLDELLLLLWSKAIEAEIGLLLMVVDELWLGYLLLDLVVGLSQEGLLDFW